MTLSRRLLLAAPVLLPALARAAEGWRPDPAFPRHGPAAAAGALVWLHAHYTEGDPPSLPPFLAPLAARWDVWRIDRAPRLDPLAPGAALLAEATAALRRDGYRQVAVVGESRGAFVAVTALRQPGLADALLALAPAAHGTRAERRAAALADWRAALAAMAPGAVARGGLVLFAEDPYDPDPDARATAFRDAMQASGATALVIDRPATPTGHGAARDPEFDPRFGAPLRALLAGAAGPG